MVSLSYLSKVGSGFAIVHIVVDDAVAPLTAVVREHGFLRVNM